MRLLNSNLAKIMVYSSLILGTSVSNAQDGILQKLCRIVMGGSANSSNFDPATLNKVEQYSQTHNYSVENSKRENPNRVVSKNDQRFMDQIWKYVQLGRGRGSIETSRERYTTQYSSILVTAFGVEPRCLSNGESYISERGLTFDSGMNFYVYRGGPKKAIAERIFVTVTPEKAIVEFKTISESEKQIAALAESIPESQLLLKKFLGKPKKKNRPTYISGDAIFDNFMNAGDRAEYHHYIEISRDDLTAFMIELDEATFRKL
jgi:hypothetical protein